ncbi:hypothetical protein [Rhodoblastus sp.]|jgi:hypothetical protein|uniref:beta strand repeat-containing protein n=1 Tax=Rhodoblastus sp. TaxID=1962975 RepID=UPI0025E7DE1D|nr:hypothetical protein [Rhodoblastus sp.]
MSRTISTLLSGTLTLAPTDNPLTITFSGGVAATAPGADAIDGGTGVNWSITNSYGSISSATGYGVYLLGPAAIVNYGAISGNGGVRLGAGGTVSNRYGGSITGKGASGPQASVSGIYFDGASGSVANAGTITASGIGYGIGFAAGGSVNNSGVIAGGEDGVFFDVGGVGSVTNSGSITASIDDGVAFNGGGSLTNQWGGSIKGLAGANAAAVFVTGGSAKIINYGFLAGRKYGILIAAGGTITNQQDGTITGQTAGVSLSHGGSVSNAGSIITTTAGGAGADLEQGGSINNKWGGAISGTSYGIFVLGAAGTIVNQGLISATTLAGVQLGAGGVVTNLYGAAILGQNTAVNLANVSANVVNSGSISAVAAGSAGVTIGAGGLVTNNSGGIIAGVGYAVFASGVAATVNNGGQLTGAYGIGLNAGGVVNNIYGGAITAQIAGIFVGGGAGTITNDGVIAGSAPSGGGVDLESGGSVVNQGDGVISGGYAGVFINGGSGTVTNAGTISGGVYAIDFVSNNAANRVIDDPQSVFNGLVSGGGGTLEVAKGWGDLAGLGTSQFQNFRSLQVDSGANWTLHGAGNSIAVVIDNGVIAIDGSLDVSVAVDVGSTGSFLLGAGDSLEIAQALGSGSKIDFQNSGELILDNAALFGTGVGTAAYKGDLLENFSPGSAIDLHNFSLAGAIFNYNAPSGLLQITNSAHQLATLDFQDSTLAGGTFHLGTDGSSGVLITRS